MALDGLDRRVERGEIFGFLGPNGAGKSTIIRLLLDLIRPMAGRARVLGMDWQARSKEVRAVTGYLPGDVSLCPGLAIWSFERGDISSGAREWNLRGVVRRVLPCHGSGPAGEDPA